MLTPFLLLSAAACSAVVAILHVYIIFKGAAAYRRFGAGEAMATLAERGSWFPATLTWGITVVFVVFAAYYAAAAGWLPEPPLLRAGLIAIAMIYTLRGAMVVPGALLSRRMLGRPMTSFECGSSVVSLLIGLLHLAGAWLWFTHDCAAHAGEICSWLRLSDTGPGI